MNHNGVELGACSATHLTDVTANSSNNFTTIPQYDTSGPDKALLSPTSPSQQEQGRVETRPAPQDFYPNGLTITCNALTIVDKIPPGSLTNTALPNVFSPITAVASAVFNGCKKENFYRIQNIHTTFKPGNMYLILAGPGSGKSALLRALASKAQVGRENIFYNNLTADQLSQHLRVDVRKLVAYMDQTDHTHNASLTVEETLLFTARLSLWDEKKSTAENESFIKSHVDNIIDLLELRSCAQTLVGGPTIRGISGGQKRRVSLGNVLCTNAQVLLLDQYSDGLDSKTVQKITERLYDLARSTGKTIISALQQPGKEIVELYDHILLMREGNLVYSGPRSDTQAYVHSLGYIKPNDVELADFLIDILLSPHQVIVQQYNYLQHLQQIEEDKKKQNQDGKQPNKMDKARRKTLSAMHATLNPRKSLVGPEDVTVQEQMKKPVKTSLGLLEVSPDPRVTTEEMLGWYEISPHYKAMKAAVGDVVDNNQKFKQNNFDLSTSFTSSTTPYTLTTNSTMQSAVYPLSAKAPVGVMYKEVVRREVVMMSRSKINLISRLLNCILLGFVYGGLYWNTPEEDFFMRFAGFIVILTQLGFSALISLSPILEASLNVKRDLSNHIFSPTAYVFACFFASLPLLLVELSLFSIILYWMIGNVANAGNFFIYFGLLLLQATQLDLLFKTIATFVSTFEAASTLGQTFVSFACLLSGFFVAKDAIPDWMIEFYWVSPFSWSARALLLNEFKSSRYDQIVAYVDPFNGAALTERVGDLYLSRAGLPTDRLWMLWGPLYLLGLIFLLILAHRWALGNQSAWYEESRGTRRSPREDYDQQEMEVLLKELAKQQEQFEKQFQATINSYHQDNTTTTTNNDTTTTPRVGPPPLPPSAIAAAQATLAAQQQHGLKLDAIQKYFPTAPLWLSFHNLGYTIKVKNAEGQQVDKQLLQNCSGFAEPGKLTCMMGPSGSGKTTMLDVLSFRKNQGTVQGEVLFNGQKPTRTMVETLVGYCEQFDSLFPYTTVYDSLLFAAQLRLSVSIPTEAKKKIVEELMELLDLTPLRDCLVGGANIPGLSQAQLKRLNIGIELVSNPSVLFLDECTSALDSAAAASVIKVVRRIATVLKKSIICTIHQPSSELWYMFDRLCMLAPGGHLTFFGSLGPRGLTAINFFEGCSLIESLPADKNPASWLLEQCGEGEHVDRITRELQELYQKSVIWKDVQEQLTLLQAITVTSGGNNAGEDMTMTQSDLIPTEAMPQHQRNASLTAQKIPSQATPVQARVKPNLFTQFGLLLSRNFNQYYRGSFTIARLLTAVFLSLLFGLLYYNQKQDAPFLTQAEMMSRIASYGVVVYFGATVASSSLPAFELRSVFYREKSSGFYSPAIWATVAFCNEVIWTAPYAVLLTSILYPINQSPDGADHYFLYLLVCYLAILTYTATTLWITACAPNTAISASMMSAYLGMFFFPSFSVLPSFLFKI